MDDIPHDIALISSIAAVPTILDVVCRTTGMGFAAVARVTEGRWVACSVLDHIHFGLKAGGELEVESTICHEIRQVQEPVIIDHVAVDEIYKDHHTPQMYGFQSYISMPIFLTDGRFFGTLCAIDPKPAVLNTPGVIGMFKLFADLIAFHIDAADKLAASELRLSVEKESSELREQFIAVLGHDLRSPLGAISMGAQILKESGLAEKPAMLADMISKSAVNMSGLIEDVMDFARGRLGGGITLDPSSEPLEPVLRQVVSAMETLWPGRAIKVEISMTERIRYDRKRISQLFTNLLSNAMSYGKPEQPVRVGALSGGGRFELSVANAAEPIPEWKQQKLFEPFSRGGSENYQEGLGLGLYIASQIAKSHGGTLEVISTEEETRFTFSMASEV